MSESSDEDFVSKPEATRTMIFLAIQAGFLVLSPLTGGGHKTVWSMLDSAILVLSIGITGLVFTLDLPRHRKLAFRVAVVLYILGVLDMSLNIFLSGIFGWKGIF